jgi:hypothetical protein
MTPEEINRTMEFILRSQADSVIRMERFSERDERLQAQIDSLASATRDLLTISRNTLDRLDRLEGEAG